MADMRLDRLLREEKASADLAVHEAVGNELKNLELAARGLLLDAKRSAERNDLTAGSAGPALSDLLETSRVIDITTQDVPSLCSVHGPGYRPSAGLSSPSIQGLPATPPGGARLQNART
jgi:hypothetical protein